jgi:hypothetical protein
MVDASNSHPIRQQGKLLSLIVILALISGCFAPTEEPQSFTLEFPATADLGELRLVEDVNCFSCGNGQEDLGHATGVHHVRLPQAHWYISLRMPKTAAGLLPFLAHPSLIHIGDLDVEGSDVKDEDLQYLSRINLRSIDLSNTKITGAGLKYLKPHKRWIFVSLQDCDALEPHYLVHFKGWKRATIRVTSRKWTGKTPSQADIQLLAQAKHIICEDQPEEVCNTQIR